MQGDQARVRDEAELGQGPPAGEKLCGQGRIPRRWEFEGGRGVAGSGGWGAQGWGRWSVTAHGRASARQPQPASVGKPGVLGGLPCGGCIFLSGL